MNQLYWVRINSTYELIKVDITSTLYEALHLKEDTTSILYKALYEEETSSSLYKVLYKREHVEHYTNSMNIQIKDICARGLFISIFVICL